MTARTPIPSGLRGKNPEGEAEEELVGETRVAEGAATRGDGEIPRRGPGALKSLSEGSGPWATRNRLRLKNGLGAGRSLGGGDLGGIGVQGSRRMGAREGSWRWGGSRVWGLTIKGLRAGERGSEL